MYISRTLVFVHAWQVDLCLPVMLSEKENCSFMFTVCCVLGSLLMGWILEFLIPYIKLDKWAVYFKCYNLIGHFWVLQIWEVWRKCVCLCKSKNIAVILLVNFTVNFQYLDVDLMMKHYWFKAYWMKGTFWSWRQFPT